MTAKFQLFCISTMAKLLQYFILITAVQSMNYTSTSRKYSAGTD